VSGGIDPPFMTSALDGGEWSASRPDCCTPGESLWCPLDRRLNGPQSRSEHHKEEKNFASAGNRSL
jgi:hypothetical protein